MQAGDRGYSRINPACRQRQAMKDKTTNQQPYGFLPEAFFARNHSDQVKNSCCKIDQQSDFKEQDVCCHDEKLTVRAWTLQKKEYVAESGNVQRSFFIARRQVYPIGSIKITNA